MRPKSKTKIIFIYIKHLFQSGQAIVDEKHPKKILGVFNACQIFRIFWSDGGAEAIYETSGPRR